MLNHFEEIRIYVEVVKSGNFTLAAKSLALSKQMVSRRIMALEERLGARLLNRTTRKLSPTELGKVFYARCALILQGLHEAEQAVSNQSDELRGLLRISAPLSFASMMLSPALNAFMHQHPQLQISLEVDNRLVDVIGDGYDMVIRITRQPDEGLIARKLMNATFVYCCSPAYAQQYGIPQTLHDIKTHRCITHPSAEWLFKQDGEIRKIQMHPILRSSHGEVMREAAIAGLGITGLPEFYVTEAIQHGRLIPILQAYTFDIDGVYAMYPQHRQLSPAVRALTQHLQAWFARG